MVEAVIGIKIDQQLVKNNTAKLHYNASFKNLIGMTAATTIKNGTFQDSGNDCGTGHGPDDALDAGSAIAGGLPKVVESIPQLKSRTLSSNKKLMKGKDCFTKA
jgi:hypothetical protein